MLPGSTSNLQDHRTKFSTNLFNKALILGVNIFFHFHLYLTEILLFASIYYIEKIFLNKFR